MEKRDSWRNQKHCRSVSARDAMAAQKRSAPPKGPAEQKILSSSGLSITLGRVNTNFASEIFENEQI
jgi:hypothetical protein